MTAEAGFVHNIPNAWMASVRRHPFWLFVLQEITRTVGAGDFARRARTGARLQTPCIPRKARLQALPHARVGEDSAMHGRALLPGLAWIDTVFHALFLRSPLYLI